VEMSVKKFSIVEFINVRAFVTVDSIAQTANKVVHVERDKLNVPVSEVVGLDLEEKNLVKTLVGKLWIVENICANKNVTLEVVGVVYNGS